MSAVEDLVCKSIRARSEIGAVKYGTTMERTDLKAVDWLRHAQEEAMDLSVYLQRLVMDFNKATDILYSDMIDSDKIRLLKDVL